MMLDGFDEDTGRDIGPQEQATRRIVKDLEDSHPEYDPIRDGLCQAMLPCGQHRQPEPGGP